MKKQPSDVIKLNRDYIDQQRKDFSRAVSIIGKLINFSSVHPFLSLLFIVVLGLFVNLFSSLIEVFRPTNALNYSEWTYYAYWLGGLGVAMLIIVGIIFQKYSSIFRDTPLHEKKVIITIASVRRDESDIPSPAESFIEAMLYDEQKVKRNLLEKIYILVSEDPNVMKYAEEIRKTGTKERTIELLPIKIKGQRNNIFEIKKQIDEHITEIKKEHSVTDIIADFTGGTKEIGVALFLACQDHFILAAYLDSVKTSSTGQKEKTNT